jgi:multidrug efflux system membrane fusion protein
MKRVVYLLIVIAAGLAFYLFAYPRLTGAVPAGTTTSAPQGADAGASRGRRGAGATAVVVAVADKQTVPILKTAVGFVEATDEAVVRARADGLVISANVIEGQNVKKGDVLFKLDDVPIQNQIAKDNAQIAKDQANADFTAVDLTRSQALFKTGNVNQQQLDTAVAAAKSAAASVTVDQVQLQADQLTLSYMTITAPIDGRVGALNTSIGDTVHASDTSTGGLLTITQMEHLRTSFQVPERDLDSFRKALADNAKLPVQIFVAGDKTPRATGTLAFIDSSIDTGSGTVTVKADVDNSAGALWPGQYITVSVQVGAYTDATTVPVVAVQQSSNGPFVLVVGADKKVKQQPVTVTASIDDTAIIGPEIKPGDQVVVEGQLGLTDGATVSVAEAGQTAAPANANANAPASATGGHRRQGKDNAGVATPAAGAPATTGAPATPGAPATK